MNKRLKAILLAALAAITIVLCSSCSKDKNKIDDVKRIVSVKKVKMDTYEHTLSVPVKTDNTNNTIQYEYHDGYEVVGITSAAYGRYTDSYYGGSIIYVNDEPVICKNSGSNNLDFGTPENPKETTIQNIENYKVFDVGEHIISIPVGNNISNEIFQYPYHEGYKVVGASTSAYGRFFPSCGGGALLYVNVVPVKCHYSEDGYTSFGTPIAETKLVLSKEN